MHLRHAAAAFLICLGMPVAAQCVGASYLDQLDPARRAALAEAADALPFSEGTMWTATRGADTITVVGTMHIYDPRLEPIYDEISDEVAAADLIMLEATPKEEAELQELIITDPDLLFITEGPTLPTLLDEETWGLIAKAATDRGVPGFMAAKMQPWYLSLILSIPPCATQDMLAGDLGLDHMISEGAIEAGVPMQALEPMTTLFEVFQDSTFDEQIDMLMVNLSSPVIQQQMFVAMLDSYFAQDVGTLWEMSRIAMTEVPGVDEQTAKDMFANIEDSLLIKRNRNWMPVIADAVAEHDDLVVAVGAAHLIGQEGILQFLQDDGWTLTRIE
ncbi:TraB/GumN family protein [Cognatiyoonia sp. IB215446]|uniref:TraB/GumN family protein n=1 Tax=Cognatiyoonia sp. IB215446 TaxID=3097355 RepID=UPI002A0BA44F|nr:TraB/GumN family protein [Cognatiyoonia sp. IB215446]MDX8349917.1 TraB/GumN family protein [Cognatiyoonia sp. IB215446]